MLANVNSTSMTSGVEQECNWEAVVSREVAAGVECGQLEQGRGEDEPERGGAAVEDPQQLWPAGPGDLSPISLAEFWWLLSKVAGGEGEIGGNQQSKSPATSPLSPLSPGQHM